MNSKLNYLCTCSESAARRRLQTSFLCATQCCAMTIKCAEGPADHEHMLRVSTTCKFSTAMDTLKQWPLLFRLSQDADSIRITVTLRNITSGIDNKRVGAVYTVLYTADANKIIFRHSDWQEQGILPYIQLCIQH